MATTATAELRQRIRELHADGLSDLQMMGILRRARETIRIHRTDMGLPANYEAISVCRAHDQAIRRMTKEGCSARTIAERLGVSRNAVIGYRGRNNITGPVKTGGQKARATARASAAANKRDPYKGDAPTGCRYPYGEGADLKWCNAERRGGSPYCPEHHALCHKPIMAEAAE